MQKKLVLALALSLFPFIVVHAGVAQSRMLDFDGDGLSDLVAIMVQHDNSANELAFRIIQSSDSQLVKKEFGKSEELAVVADYDGDGKTDFAVVGQNTDGTLLWRIKQSSLNDEIITSSFGTTNDLVISGCFFDGDAKADMAVIQNKASLLFEKSSDSTTGGFTFDLTNPDGFYCADLNGDNIDELIVYQLLSSTQVAFVAWDVNTGVRVSENIIDGQATNVLAADIDGDGVVEIGFENKSKKRTKLSFLVGGAIQTFTFAEFSSYIFGKFVAGSAAEGAFVKVKHKNAFKTYTPLSAFPTSFTIADSDSIVPRVQVDTPGPAISKESGCQVQHEAYDGPNGFLWKPVSDSTGKVAVHLPAGNRFRKTKFVKNGQVLETPYYGGNGNGSRDLFRSRYKYTYFPNDVTVMSQSKGQTHCWLVEDPSQRID